jgi:dolichol kinase
MQLLQQRKNGEIRSSLVLVFLMMAVLTFVFWGCLGEEWKYVTVVSVMAWGFGDGAAALVGKRFGRNVVNHRWVEGKKTVEGSIAMYGVAALALFFSLFLLTATPWYYCLIAALCVAPICSVVELFSRNGTDTITVPLATAIPTFLIMKFFSIVAA